MELKTLTLSLQGKARENNEDNCFADSKIKLMIVADGMGGYQAGEVASTIAVTAVVESIIESLNEAVNDDATFDPEEAIRSAFYYANQLIYTRSEEEAELKQMGSTLTVAWLVNDILYIGHVGDSRAYFFGKHTQQLTIDHSVTEALLREGGITQEEALEHPRKHVLTRALGAEPRVAVDIYKFTWDIDDLLLICSDGLSNALNLEAILAQVDVRRDKTQIFGELVKMALEAGSMDDITGVLAWHHHQGLYREDLNYDW